MPRNDEPKSAPVVARPEADARERLAPVDLAWLRMDDPTNLMMISGVLTFEEELPLERLRQVIERRLLPIRRFRRRVVGSVGAGRLFWEDDPAFDLDRHLLESRLPGPGGDEELREEVSRLMSRPLEMDRPLWCFHLVQGYKGGSALVGRLHHAIGDGLALVLVILSLTERSPEWPLAEDGASRQANPFSRLFAGVPGAMEAVRRHAEELMPEGMKLLLKPVEALRRANPFLRGVASLGAAGKLTFRSADPKTLLKGPLGVAKRATWSRAIPVSELRGLAERAGGNLNDLLITAISGALGHYLAGRGAAHPEDFSVRAAVPVNLRPLERMARLGNEFGLVFLPLPIGVRDPKTRLGRLRQTMRALKSSAEPVAAFQILRALGLSPLAVQRLVVRIIATKATAVLTSVPGPSEPLYLGGKRMSGMFFWVPQAGRVALGISILSYAGEVRIGIASDAGLIPDPDAIVTAFYRELDLFRDAHPDG